MTKAVLQGRRGGGGRGGAIVMRGKDGGRRVMAAGGAVVCVVGGVTGGKVGGRRHGPGDGRGGGGMAGTVNRTGGGCPGEGAVLVVVGQRGRRQGGAVAISSSHRGGRAIPRGGRGGQAPAGRGGVGVGRGAGRPRAGTASVQLVGADRVHVHPVKRWEAWEASAAGPSPGPAAASPAGRAVAQAGRGRGGRRHREVGRAVRPAARRVVVDQAVGGALVTPGVASSRAGVVVQVGRTPQVRVTEEGAHSDNLLSSKYSLDVDSGAGRSRPCIFSYYFPNKCSVFWLFS